MDVEHWASKLKEARASGVPAAKCDAAEAALKSARAVQAERDMAAVELREKLEARILLTTPKAQNLWRRALGSGRAGMRVLEGWAAASTRIRERRAVTERNMVFSPRGFGATKATRGPGAAVNMTVHFGDGVDTSFLHMADAGVLDPELNPLGVVVTMPLPPGAMNHRYYCTWLL